MAARGIDTHRYYSGEASILPLVVCQQEGVAARDQAAVKGQIEVESAAPYANILTRKNGSGQAVFTPFFAHCVSGRIRLFYNENSFGQKYFDAQKVF